MKLYEFGPTRAARCRWVLQELGVPFEAEEVRLDRGAHRSPEFLALNPYGRVPVLVDGDLVLTESIAICTTLADRHPERGLIPPPGSDDRGRHDQWLSFAGVELDQATWRVHCHLRVYPRERRVPVAAELGRQDFAAAAAVAEAHLADREVLVGDRFQVADVVLAHTLIWAGWYGLTDEFPALRAYAERHRRRPACPEALR